MATLEGRREGLFPLRHCCWGRAVLALHKAGGVVLGCVALLGCGGISVTSMLCCCADGGVTGMRPHVAPVLTPERSLPVLRDAQWPLKALGVEQSVVTL